ncbi:hypothetical protein GCM10017687_55680 [Streptomyces echinatus]
MCEAASPSSWLVSGAGVGGVAQDEEGLNSTIRRCDPRTRSGPTSWRSTRCSPASTPASTLLPRRAAWRSLGPSITAPDTVCECLTWESVDPEGVVFNRLDDVYRPAARGGWLKYKVR